MSDPTRHTRFLVSRLREMQIEVEPCASGTSAEGCLELSPAPFETLEEPFRTEVARFYTLGHNRLKFFDPAPFFELAALDVGRCRSGHDIEGALRRAWGAALRGLRDARQWLEGIGARVRPSTRGTRLLLGVTGLDGPAALVRSPGEVLLPSAGPLAELSLAEPESRRLRPPRQVELAVELELALGQCVERQLRAARERETRPRTPLEALTADGPSPRRVLVVDDDGDELATTEHTLRLQNFEITTRRDGKRALESFDCSSFDLVLVDRSMPRMDGLELTMRLRELPGIEALPVAVLDDRHSDAHAQAARDVGAVAYLRKPLVWSDVGDTLLDLADCYTRRRYRRYPVRLAVQGLSAGSGATELTEEISRRGMRLRTRRELFPGALEVYRIALPPPLGPVVVEGEVRQRVAQPGQVALLAGVRFRRFFDDGEKRWIELIQRLTRRDWDEG